MRNRKEKRGSGIPHITRAILCYGIVQIPLPFERKTQGRDHWG